ncbi:MAG TPA: phosphotransferase family protein [Mycobacteriales bacterium]
MARTAPHGHGEHTELPVDRVERWLAEHGIALEPPVRAELISGGRSNLTYGLTGADGRVVVLRRPPQGGVLESAHDMGREWRFIDALRGTAVPVADALARDETGDVIGAPFYVMSYVEGLVPHDAAAAEALSPDARLAAAGSLVDTMVALHGVDVDAVGLGDIGRREGYVQRQLRRWKRQWDQSSCTDIIAIGEVHDRLSERVPAEARTGIVHGDFRLGNMMCGPDGRIRAVLDWELATLGDPLADLGWLLSSWAEPGEAYAGPGGAAPPSVLPGFPPRSWLVERYGERSGADLSAIDFYVAFAIWRGCCISAGVLTRYQSGVMGDDGFDASPLRDQIVERAEAALTRLRQM